MHKNKTRKQKKWQNKEHKNKEICSFTKKNSAIATEHKCQIIKMKGKKATVITAFLQPLGLTLHEIAFTKLTSYSTVMHVILYIHGMLLKKKTSCSLVAIQAVGAEGLSYFRHGI